MDGGGMIEWWCNIYRYTTIQFFIDYEKYYLGAFYKKRI